MLDFTFDSLRRVTGITMDTGQADPTFKLITFQQNTANFTQAKSSGNAVNVAQQINFIEPGMDEAVLSALYDLNLECCGVYIVLDNQGNYWLFGISYFSESGTWKTEDMQTGEGSADSGTDPTADAAQITESLTCNANFYALKWTLGEAGIPV